MILPSQDYRRTHIQMPDKLHKGLDGAVHGLVGLYRRRPGLGRSLKQQAEEISEAI